MHVLHVIWSGGRPAVWAETKTRRRAPPGFAACSATARELLSVCRSCFWYEDGFDGGSPVQAMLPTFRSRARPGGAAAGAPAKPWLVQALFPSAPNLLMFLSDVKGSEFAPGMFLAPDVLHAAALFRAAAAMAAEGRYLPQAAFEDGAPYARWTAAPLAREETWLAALPPDSREMFAWLLDRFVRRASMTVLTREIPGRARFGTVHDAWLAALRSESGAVPFDRLRPRFGGGTASAPGTGGGEDASAPARDFESLAAALDSWKSPLRETPSARAALEFSLDAPEGGGWILSARCPEFTRSRLLALGQATSLFPPLALAAKAPGGCAVGLSPSQALDFMRSGAGDLAAAGYAVRFPENVLGEHFSAVAELEPSGPEPEPDKGGRDARAASAARDVAVKFTVRVDGEPVSESEIRFLLDQGEPLVFFRDRWIEVDRGILREALRAMEMRRKGKCTLREAAAFAFDAGRAGRLRVTGVKAKGWLRRVLDGLSGAGKIPPFKAPAGLKAELRPYQARGAAWLAFLAKWNFGACLADDMGLGKTVQAIAALMRMKADGMKGPAIVFAPLTVLPNWKRELERFAPSLRVISHSGAGRLSGRDFRIAANAADVVLAPYSLAARDFADISSVSAAAVVLDEAQAVKNPETRVSRAIRALDPPVRIALTGTPLENRVTDLWSIEDFLNPGLLGTRSAFEESFGRAGAAAGGKLAQTLAPFILRRLKTDPAISAELGAKRETREYCLLSPGQRAMYESALSDFSRGGPGGERPAPGEALALLVRLKEICDAPQLAGGEGASGKLDRLEELVESFFANGESCLVFTQYARAGALVRSRLMERFGRRMPFLHGALSPKRREEEIAAFCGSPDPLAFILSLRAGGFGLNLVKATRVVHFDRWWNPAVEDQATDRAYRIGQDKDVFVHLFICSGTVEDRVDRLLEEKRRLAEGIVGSGESMLLEMSRGELVKTAELEQP